jgi:hypothetical protein
MMRFTLVMLPMMVLIVAVYGAAFAFRALSASRPLWLAPHARVKMLTAIVLYLLTAALVIAAGITWIAPVDTSQSGRVAAGAFVLAFLFLSGAVWIQFLRPVLLLWLTIGVLPGLLLLRRVLEQSGWSVLTALISAAVLTILAWTWFAFWYLGLRRLSSYPRQFANIGVELFARRVTSSSPALSHPDASRRAYWRARPELPTYHRWLLGPLIGLVFLGVPLISLHVLVPPGPVPLQNLFLVLPLGLTLLIGVAANMSARRSRLLWLRSGRSRAQLFEDADKQLWHSDAHVMLAGALLATPILLRALLDVELAVLGMQVLAAGGTAAFAHYLGLMCIRGTRIGDSAAIAWLLATGVAAGWALVASDDPLRYVPAVAAIQIGSALSCRAVARRRWVTIDWTSFRLMRLPGQGIRP